MFPDFISFYMFKQRVYNIYPILKDKLTSIVKSFIIFAN